MRIIFKFADGTKVIDEEFFNRTRSEVGSFIDNVQSWKDNDSPMKFDNGDDSVEMTGKDLVSVEIVPE
jgi:hypothetical protein